MKPLLTTTVVWGVVFLAAVLLVGQANAWDDESAQMDAAIDAGVRFLISRQSKIDGGWHSEFYGTMNQGAASTSLVVYSLSHLPKDKLSSLEDCISKASRFVKRGIAKDGSAGNSDGSLDYPVYGTALILSANQQLGLGIQANDIQRMVDYLLSSQCNEQRGFEPTNVNFGGWDILGNRGPEDGKTPGANVSVTYYVTEALVKYSGVRKVAISQSLQQAKDWSLKIARKSEGNGFYFSAMEDSPLNKAGKSSSGKPNSYGSATHDGLGILVNCGCQKDNQGFRRALEWLNQNQHLLVPGFDGTRDDSAWPQALQFYYLAGCSRTIHDMRHSGNLRKKIIEKLLSAQKENGSWQNAVSNMREDDPLIATSLAVIALCNLKK